MSIESSAGVPPENDRGPLELVWTLPQKVEAIASPQPLPGQLLPGKWQLPWFRNESPFARAVSVHARVRVLVKPGDDVKASLSIQAIAQ